MFNYVNIVGVLRSGGDTKVCLFLDCSGVWLIGIPMAFIGGLVLKQPIYIVYAMDLDGRDSFTILFVDEGEITINGAYRLGKGELLLLPAVMKQVTIETNGAKVLETYIPHEK